MPIKPQERKRPRRLKVQVIIGSLLFIGVWRFLQLLHIATKEGENNQQAAMNAPRTSRNSMHAEGQHDNSTLVSHQQPKAKNKLRNDWMNNPPLSATAKQILEHQSNCDLPVATFHVDNDYGLGSHLTLWSQAVCNGMALKTRLRTENPVWLWMDRELCDAQQAKRSPLLCYFPQAEFLCGEDENVSALNVTDPKQTQNWCPYLRQEKPKHIQYEPKLADFRAASIEFIFRAVAPVVIEEAERQASLVFGTDDIPDDLITVHMRWGDKFWEMDLAYEREYIQAVSNLLGRDNRTANIYLATEDPRAKEAFLNATPAGWNVYLDRTLDELDDFRPKKGNRASHTAKNTRGRAGLVAMGSLLVAMEAKSFVLTTKSNWSRLMDFLRTNVIDPRCGNCTNMVDLRPGIW